jgi:hypothetical protein
VVKSPEIAAKFAQPHPPVVGIVGAFVVTTSDRLSAGMDLEGAVLILLICAPDRD